MFFIILLCSLSLLLSQDKDCEKGIVYPEKEMIQQVIKIQGLVHEIKENATN